ncbi:MAG: hypothetical protein LBI86_00980 [Treponema sp.]|jgi:hypothetical protein|nr:hypothetical protein [Treponema sp.]
MDYFLWNMYRRVAMNLPFMDSAPEQKNLRDTFAALKASLNKRTKPPGNPPYCDCALACLKLSLSYREEAAGFLVNNTLLDREILAGKNGFDAVTEYCGMAPQDDDKVQKQACLVLGLAFIFRMEDQEKDGPDFRQEAGGNFRRYLEFSKDPQVTHKDKAPEKKLFDVDECVCRGEKLLEEYKGGLDKGMPDKGLLSGALEKLSEAINIFFYTKDSLERKVWSGESGRKIILFPDVRAPELSEYSELVDIFNPSMNITARTLELLLTPLTEEVKCGYTLKSSSIFYNARGLAHYFLEEYGLALADFEESLIRSGSGGIDADDGNLYKAGIDGCRKIAAKAGVNSCRRIAEEFQDKPASDLGFIIMQDYEDLLKDNFPKHLRDKYEGWLPKDMNDSGG